MSLETYSYHLRDGTEQQLCHAQSLLKWQGYAIFATNLRQDMRIKLNLLSQIVWGPL